MALPTENTALGDYFDDLLYTGAYLAGSKGHQGQGKKVLEARKTLEQQVAARNARHDERVLAAVAEAIAWDVLAEPLESFERQVDAHFDRDRAGYGAVFPRTKAVMLATKGAALRAKVFEPVLAFARKANKDKLGAAGKELWAAWGEYAQAAAASDKADQALSRAIAEVGRTKRRGVVLMRETEGALRAHYAATPKAWKKVFRKRAAAKAGGTDAPAPPPASTATGG